MNTHKTHCLICGDNEDLVRCKGNDKKSNAKMFKLESKQEKEMEMAFSDSGICVPRRS